MMRDRLKEYAYIVLVSLPAMVLTLNYLLSGTGGGLYRTTFRNRLHLSLITFSHLPRPYVFISIALFASALFLILKNSSLRNRFYPAMAIILFTGYLLMPIDGMSGSFIYGRFFLYSFILLSFGMDAVEGRQVDLARLFLVLVCLIGFSWLVQYCREFNRDFSTVCSGAIRERSVLMTVDVTRSRSLIRPFNSAWGYFLQKKAFLDYSVICGINQQIKYRTSRPDLNRYGDGQGQGEVRGPLRAIRESYDYVLLFGKDRNVEERLDSISEKVCSDRMVSLYKLQRLTGPVLRN